MDDLPGGRNHKLNGVASRVIVNSAGIVFQVVVCLEANIHALAGGLPLFLKPCEIGSLIVRGYRCLRLRHQSVHYILHVVFQPRDRKSEAVPTFLQTLVGESFRNVIWTSQASGAGTAV